MKKLAVFFPGIGYTVDKPLMHYGRRLAMSLGYEVKLLPYGGFPEKKPGDTDRIRRSFEIALAQSEEMLSGLDFSEYEDILFIGKSIGTIAAAKIASESPAKDRIRLILYTPLPETFLPDFGSAVVFTGTDDPWVGKEKSPIPALSAKRGIPCHLIEGGNHSLESADIGKDILTVRKIMEITEAFIRARED
ncbi:MAG: alpha/beta hydrolase [Lachnospiraceae bacterium]|nr:alpha/beta hydrolase [Lachnospiraceae bacterium]